MLINMATTIYLVSSKCLSMAKIASHKSSKSNIVNSRPNSKRSHRLNELEERGKAITRPSVFLSRFSRVQWELTCQIVATECPTAANDCAIDYLLWPVSYRESYPIASPLPIRKRFVRHLYSAQWKLKRDVFFLYGLLSLTEYTDVCGVDGKYPVDVG